MAATVLLNYKPFMLVIALWAVLGQASCYEGLGAPDAPTYRALLEKGLPLWQTPQDFAVDSDETAARERQREFTAVRRFILEAKANKAALDELIRTKRAALLRLDAYLARFPDGSQLRRVGDDLKATVNQECSDAVTFQVQLAAVNVAKLEAATPAPGLGDPMEGVVAQSLITTLRNLEAGWILSPWLGWYGQQLSHSTPPVQPSARDCAGAIDEFLVGDELWRRVVTGLTLDQLVAFCAVVPRIEMGVEEKWCGSSASPSVTADANGLHEVALSKYSTCMEKVFSGWLHLNRGTSDPMIRRAASDQWRPLVNPVRIAVGARALGPQDTW